ncbi:hypothetical protein QQP08_010286 [Theobroma cacao]|nr:hypothetical protein QQP08_010286 [Theobroma cacao]
MAPLTGKNHTEYHQERMKNELQGIEKGLMARFLLLLRCLRFHLRCWSHRHRCRCVKKKPKMMMKRRTMTKMNERKRTHGNHRGYCCCCCYSLLRRHPHLVLRNPSRRF